jgi:hypothetical protein
MAKPWSWPDGQKLRPPIDHLREQARGRDDIRTECAGVIAGSWFAKPARRGEDLIAVGLLMLAGHVDLDQLDHWVRVGWERRRRIRTAKTRLTLVMAAPGSESGLGDGWRMEHGTDR